MISINNLGFHTDCIARKLDGQFSSRNAYHVLRMPNNPTYYWGNLLVFRKEPQKGDFRKWISAFKSEFGEDIGHITFGWESQKTGLIDDFLRAGFHHESESVLVLGKIQDLQPNQYELKIRKIETDEDWSKVLSLQIYVSEGDDPSKEYVAFKTRSFKTYRKLSENGDGNWWGAFLGDTLIGDMGLYFDDSHKTGRFQSVETHPSYRKAGVCSKLLHSVSNDALSKHPGIRLVICTEKDSNTEGIYRKLGFVRHQAQHGVCLPGKLKIDAIPSLDTTPANAPSAH